jgi:hypothetical protein
VRTPSVRECGGETASAASRAGFQEESAKQVFGGEVLDLLVAVDESARHLVRALDFIATARLVAGVAEFVDRAGLDVRAVVGGSAAYS